jgi:hypothetical protein
VIADRWALVADLRAFVSRLEDDIRARIGEVPVLRAHLADEHRKAVEAQRTATSVEEWREGEITQAAVAWVLACVFVRFMEDNGLIDSPLISGAGDRRAAALGHREEHFRAHPEHSDREYLESVFERVAAHPAVAPLYDHRHNPLWQLGPTADGARELRELWTRIDPHEVQAADVPGWSLFSPRRGRACPLRRGAASAPSCFSEISATSRWPRPPRSCLARRALRSALLASSVTAMAHDSWNLAPRIPQVRRFRSLGGRAGRSLPQGEPGDDWRVIRSRLVAASGRDTPDRGWRFRPRVYVLDAVDQHVAHEDVIDQFRAVAKDARSVQRDWVLRSERPACSRATLVDSAESIVEQRRPSVSWGGRHRQGRPVSLPAGCSFRLSAAPLGSPHRAPRVGRHLRKSRAVLETPRGDVTSKRGPLPES